MPRVGQSIFWMAFEFRLVDIIPDANKKINDDGFGLFGFFFMMMLFKGVFAALAGPAPNYDMQKILSSRSPKEASKDDRLCFYHFIAYPLFNGYWINCLGLFIIIK